MKTWCKRMFVARSVANSKKSCVKFCSFDLMSERLILLPHFRSIIVWKVHIFHKITEICLFYLWNLLTQSVFQYFHSSQYRCKISQIKPFEISNVWDEMWYLIKLIKINYQRNWIMVFGKFCSNCKFSKLFWQSYGSIQTNC